MDDTSGRHKIMSMEPEKRQKVLNAAMKEFNKGYKLANTDAITREAGISKGLLFHYFGSKENLYEFMVAYAFDVIINEYFKQIDFEQGDFIERLWQMVQLKMELTHRHPLVFDFIATAYRERKSKAFGEIYGHVFTELAPKAFAGIDETLFKDGIDPKKAVNLIYFTQLGYSTSQLERIDSSNLEDFQMLYDTFLSELREYFDIFRKTFYK